MAKLEIHNITINQHRTSIRLEPLFWNVLKNVAKENKITITHLCERIANAHDFNGTFTSSLRTFILAYTIHQNLEDALIQVEKSSL